MQKLVHNISLTKVLIKNKLAESDSFFFDLVQNIFDALVIC